MNRNTLAAALVAGLVLLAGCSSGLTGPPDGTTGESALDGETTVEGIEGETGTLNMYISDEENAIDDFEHLNVTIIRVGVKPAGAGTDDVENGPDGETESAADEGEEDDADEGDDEWVEYGVDNRTVDLTELTGANATKLSSLDVPNGSYETVFVRVSDVKGTLKDGSDQRVKLPSGKLQLNSGFTVGDGEAVDFVFDITAVAAGNSGKYVLRPVISESGTDVEIEDVDERDESGDAELNASFDGDIVAGETATLGVTSDGDAVDGATVFAGGERAGMTDTNGTYVVDIPDDAGELGVRASRGRRGGVGSRTRGGF